MCNERERISSIPLPEAGLKSALSMRGAVSGSGLSNSSSSTILTRLAHRDRGIGVHPKEPSKQKHVRKESGLFLSRDAISNFGLESLCKKNHHHGSDKGIT